MHTPNPCSTSHEGTGIFNRLLTVDGIRFIFTSFVSNFANFGVVAMMEVGAAEDPGLMNALIRKLVASAPKGLSTFLIVLVD